MTGKKLLIFFAAVILVGGALFLQTRQRCLGDLLPKSDWTKATLEQTMDENLSGNIRYESPPVAEILSLLRATQVSSGREKRSVENRAFRITLYRENAWPTVLYVDPTGRISLAVDMRYDNWKYYRGGAALYTALEELSETLVAVVP